MRKPFPLIITAGALAFVSIQADVTMAGVITDDFTQPKNWGTPLNFSNGANLSVGNGRMNYTSTTANNTGAAIARKTPLLPTTQDWSVKVDVHIDPFDITTDGQFADVFLGVGKTGDWVDTHVMFEFDRGYWHPGFYDIGDDVRIDGVNAPGLFNVSTLTSPDAALRLDYNAANKTITYLFDADGAAGGYNWVAQGAANLGSGVYNLNMGPADTFTLLLVGSSEEQTVAPGQAYLMNLEITAPGSTAPAGPSGDYELLVTERLNAVWDLTALADLTSEYSFEIQDTEAGATIRFARPFEQSGSGKIAGSGDTRVYIESWDEEGPDAYDFPATYKTAGAITSNRGLCKIKLSTSVTGVAYFKEAYRTVTANETLTLTLNNATLTTTGSSKATAGSSGHTIQAVDSWSEEPVTIGEGHWNLRLRSLATAGKTVTGTAEVGLHSGALHQFSLKGAYNSKTQATKLVLMGQGGAAGSSLTVTIGADNRITTVKGKLFGQMVSILN